MGNLSCKLTLYRCVVSVCCVGFESLDVVCNELYDYLLISNATVIVCAGRAIWLNPVATLLFSVCSALTVGYCVLYP